MNEILGVCPVCDADEWSTQISRTCEMHHPWKDKDGTIYDGPAERAISKKCLICGWHQIGIWKRGKFDRVESDEIPA